MTTLSEFSLVSSENLPVIGVKKLCDYRDDYRIFVKSIRSNSGKDFGGADQKSTQQANVPA